MYAPPCRARGGAGERANVPHALSLPQFGQRGGHASIRPHVFGKYDRQGDPRQRGFDSRDTQVQDVAQWQRKKWKPV